LNNFHEIGGAHQALPIVSLVSLFAGIDHEPWPETSRIHNPEGNIVGRTLICTSAFEPLAQLLLFRRLHLRFDKLRKRINHIPAVKLISIRRLVEQLGRFHTLGQRGRTLDVCIRLPVFTGVDDIEYQTSRLSERVD